jgi:hypothetical protein
MNKGKLVSHQSFGFRDDDRHIGAIYHNGSSPSLSEG